MPATNRNNHKTIPKKLNVFLGGSLFVNCYLPRFSANSNSETPGLLKAQNKNTKNFNFFLTKASLFAIISLAVADVAHPVERHLAKVEVASSSLVTRSIKPLVVTTGGFFYADAVFSKPDGREMRR